MVLKNDEEFNIEMKIFHVGQEETWPKLFDPVMIKHNEVVVWSVLSDAKCKDSSGGGFQGGPKS